MRLDFPDATFGNVMAAVTEQANTEAIRSSFPSGHMARITVLAAFGVPLLAMSGGRTRWVFAAVMAATVVNRLHFSGHTVSDLVGGFFLGAIVAWASPPLLRLARLSR